MTGMNKCEHGQMATDPVCGMKVDVGAKGPSSVHAGEIYHFCSESCRSKFAADPQRYLTKRGEAKPLPTGTLYTCPMHPGMWRKAPANARTAAMPPSRWACRRTLPTTRS